MATSGSVDFSVSRDNIITDALILAGAVGPDDSVPSTWTTHAARQLNKIVKALGAKGPSLWAKGVGYILPQTGTNEIDLGPTGDHATLSPTVTQLSADSSSTTIVVDSSTGFGASQAVGVELDDGTIHWTTQSGAAAGTTITLAVTLPSAASADNYVYTYVTKIVRPLRIVEAYLRTYTDASTFTEIPIDVITKQEYESMNNKLSTGPINMLAYEPILIDGRAYIYPRFTGGNELIKIVFQRPFEDFDASSDTPDMPQEWYDPLTLLLAVRLGPAYGLPPQERQLLRMEAKEALELALGNEPEEGSFMIMPDDQHGR